MRMSFVRTRDSVLVKSVLAVALAVVLFPGFSMAELATPAEMRQVAVNWRTTMVAVQGNWAGSTDPQVRASRDISDSDGRMIARCFDIDPDGYIVVPVLKELPPIQACSEEGTLNLEGNTYDGIIRDLVADRLDAFEAAYGSLDASQPAAGEAILGRNYRAKWDRYAVDSKSFTDRVASEQLEVTGIDPLIQTEWHQGAPYNNYCPMGYGGERCVVGCVATAYAQVLRFWQWPEHGVGNNSYLWYGDFQCGDLYYPRGVGADFSDPYDWANMPLNCDSGCTAAEQAALAELSFELGVGVEMNYGTCEGSGSFITTGLTLLPNNFEYSPSIDYHSRVSPSSWFTQIQQELNAGRPIVYGITAHAIVCDGWRIVDGIKQYHQNYGWADNHNQWYTLDELYCPVSSCSHSDEFGIFNIMPYRKAVISADTVYGWAPLTVHFTGYSDMIVDIWSWDLGDGVTSSLQNPVRTYNTPGARDISLQVTSNGIIGTSTRHDYIICLADTLRAQNVSGDPGTTVVLTISARNAIPLEIIKIPIELSGDLTALEVTDISVSGCRTDYFKKVEAVYWDPSTGRYAFKLTSSTDGSQPPLEPGEGPILKISFFIGGGAAVGQSAQVSFAGYTNQTPLFSGDLAAYQPMFVNPTIWAGPPLCCVGIRGNVNDDANQSVNVIDMTWLTQFLFSDGPPSPCEPEADVNGDEHINVIDMTWLTMFLFSGGAEPVLCP